MPEAPALFLALAVLAFVALGILAYVHEQRRRKAFAATATALGLAYEPGRSSIPAEYSRLDAFHAGSSRRLTHVLHGTYRGREVACMQFTYEVQQGKDHATRQRGVVVARVPRQWPRIGIAPETLAHKLFDAIGGEDIDFESQAFSERYWVRSEDHRFAYDLLHPRAMAHLLDGPKLSWEIENGHLCMWRESPIKPEEVEGALDHAVAFLDLAPRRLVAEAGT